MKRIACGGISTVAALVLCVSSSSGQQVFFGNLHSHTSFSDGSGTPEEAYQHARFAGLHFLAVTEHNHRWAENGASADRRDGLLIGKDPELYSGPLTAALIPTANRETETDHFIALYGQEFSSIGKGNHVNVFDVDSVIAVSNGAFDDLLAWLQGHKDTTGKTAVVQFNHPALFHIDATEYGLDDFPSDHAWVETLDPIVSLIEIVNGPAMTKEEGQTPAEIMEWDYREYLNQGFHLAPTADQDNHYRTWGTATEARTAVVIDGLSKETLIEGLRNRHVYATEDRNLELVFRVNGQLAGDVIESLPDVGEALEIRFTIRDPDEPSASYMVHVFSDLGPGGELADLVDAFSFEGDTPPDEVYAIDDITFLGNGQYVFFRVLQFAEDGNPDRAWTAPVWFESDGEDGLPIVRIVSILPNPAGDEKQNEQATLRNDGSQIVDLSGWKLRDLAKREWRLDELGSLSPGEEKTIQRQGQPMAMNNDGDMIVLVDPAGIHVQTVRYADTVEGETIEP